MAVLQNRGRLRWPTGAGLGCPAEDQLHVLGAAEVGVVGHQRLEERAAVAGHVEDDGAGHLDLLTVACGRRERGTLVTATARYLRVGRSKLCRVLDLEHVAAAMRGQARPRGDGGRASCWPVTQCKRNRRRNSQVRQLLEPLRDSRQYLRA